MDTNGRRSDVLNALKIYLEISAFLEENIYYKDIVSAVKSSFATVPQITDVKWHEEIMSDLII